MKRKLSNKTADNRSTSIKPKLSVTNDETPFIFTIPDDILYFKLALHILPITTKVFSIPFWVDFFSYFSTCKIMRQMLFQSAVEKITGVLRHETVAIASLISTRDDGFLAIIEAIKNDSINLNTRLNNIKLSLKFVLTHTHMEEFKSLLEKDKKKYSKIPDIDILLDFELEFVCCKVPDPRATRSLQRYALVYRSEESTDRETGKMTELATSVFKFDLLGKTNDQELQLLENEICAFNNLKASTIYNFYHKNLIVVTNGYKYPYGKMAYCWLREAILDLEEYMKTINTFEYY
jgi:hypothetical protein